jgi:hypothetical protein
MPPKRRRPSGPGAGPAKGSSSGKAAASGLAQQQPAEEGEHLLLDLAGTGKRRQLGRRESDEAVERSIIQTHFSGFSQIDLETQKVKGETLRERIRSDRAQLERGGRLGSTYWRDLVQEWSAVSAGIGSLHPSIKDCWALKQKA